MRERISFENVSLEGPAGRPLLEGVSAEIPAGTRTAIIGLDEDAKQALVCLIPRLIDPKVGRVRIDGRDLRDVTLESLRAQVATVLQADLVFSDSVFANIGLGDPSFDLPRIIEAAKIAHAHHFIQDLPDGYDTSSARSATTSARRAVPHRPGAGLPARPVDRDHRGAGRRRSTTTPSTLIDDTIARLAAGRTLIFLPHRLSTIRSCDQVVLLHNGRVEAVGPARELQAQSKLFRHLQYVEFNQFATGEIEAGQMGG